MKNVPDPDNIIEFDIEADPVTQAAEIDIDTEGIAPGIPAAEKISAS